MILHPAANDAWFEDSHCGTKVTGLAKTSSLGLLRNNLRLATWRGSHLERTRESCRCHEDSCRVQLMTRQSLEMQADPVVTSRGFEGDVLIKISKLQRTMRT
jgi:hypothetical protein